MPTTPSLLVFAGSLRQNSYNKQLARVAETHLKTQYPTLNVRYLDLKDYPLPIYDEDLEKEAFPKNALVLKQYFSEAQGFILSSPEYNGSFSAVLKNLIDWVSRPYPNEAPLAGFSGKTALLLSTSPGRLGGLRGLVQVRALLSMLNVLVLPEQLAISEAHQAFQNGELLHEASLKTLKTYIDRLVLITQRLHIS